MSRKTKTAFSRKTLDEKGLESPFRVSTCFGEGSIIWPSFVLGHIFRVKRRSGVACGRLAECVVYALIFS